MPPGDLDPFRPEHLEHPYGLYHRLRTAAPVHEIPGMGLWLVSRHADVREAAGRHEDFSSHLTAFVQQRTGATGSEVVELHGRDSGFPDVLATADPPDHTRQRKLVARTFREIETAEPLVTALVDEMLDPLVAARECDWIDQFAGVLPVRVIAALLGLPREDVGQLKMWSDAGVELLSGVASPSRLAECGAAVAAFAEYLTEKVDEAPTNAPDGILALLAEGVRRRELSIAEATAMAVQLVSAGSDSTGSLIGSAVRLLAEDHDAQNLVRENPNLVGAFLEEVVRLESPFRGHFRVVTKDSALAGVELPEGARLFLLWASANRDPEVFDHADELRLDRPRPRAHLGFGWGIHKCIGAPLARLESRVVLQRLLPATASIGADPNAPAPSHVPSMLVRGLARLHLELIPSDEGSL